PDARHHRIIDDVVPVDEAHAHIARVVMRAVEVVEPGEAVRRAAPPILHHILENEEQRERGDEGDARERAFIIGKEAVAERADREQDQRLRRDQQGEGADDFYDAVVARLLALREQPGAGEFEQAEAEVDARDEQARLRRGQIHVPSPKSSGRSPLAFAGVMPQRRESKCKEVINSPWPNDRGCRRTSWVSSPRRGGRSPLPTASSSSIGAIPAMPSGLSLTGMSRSGAM